MNRTTTPLGNAHASRRLLGTLKSLGEHELQLVRERHPRISSFTVELDKAPVTCTCRLQPHPTSVLAKWMESEITDDGGYESRAHTEQLCLLALAELLRNELKIVEP